MTDGRRKLVLATGNRDKIREIGAVLGDLGIEVITADEVGPWGEPVEDGATLEENALIKARAVAAATGLPALADDTGLEVDSLGGAPGVHSSRYSGEAATYESNCAKLLRELDRMGDGASRRARFRTVIATAGLAAITGNEILVDGVLEGSIAGELAGSGGFGYDAVFIPDGDVRTLAELSLDEKNAISHRGRALRSFAAAYRELSARGGIRTPTPEGTGS